MPYTISTRCSSPSLRVSFVPLLLTTTTSAKVFPQWSLALSCVSVTIRGLAVGIRGAWGLVLGSNTGLSSVADYGFGVVVCPVWDRVREAVSRLSSCDGRDSNGSCGDDAYVQLGRGEDRLGGIRRGGCHADCCIGVGTLDP